MPSRQQICASAAEALRQGRAAIAQMPVVIGFDGFVDEICAVVEKRHEAGRYEPVPTIRRLAQKIAAAADKSSNYELVVQRRKLGGNGPIMSAAMASLGARVTCIGALGWPEIHPVFAELATRAQVHGIAPPAHTDALEFADGKLMLGKLEGLSQINWANLESRLGVERFSAMLREARMIGLVNWTMLAHASQLWKRLLRDILPGLAGDRALSRGNRTVFIDLADPEKRHRDDVLGALELVSRMQSLVHVVLGLNLKEAQQVCGVLKLSEPDGRSVESLVQSAAKVREALGIECCVIHPRRCAAAATGHGTASFQGPFVHEPAISTGAGDHFNAGFMLAYLLGLAVEQCLCAGCATSGYYVRHCASPDLDQLAGFMQTMPEPE